MESAKLEQCSGNVPLVIEMVNEALKKYTQSTKLWMMGGQLKKQEKKRVDEARKFYADGVEQCPRRIPLWILVVRLEEKCASFILA